MYGNLKIICLFSFFLLSGILVSAQSMSEQKDAGEVNSTEKKEPSKAKEFFDKVMNLPFTFDFGCEPAMHGSTTYLHFKYKWSDKRYSKLLFNYSRTLTSKEAYSGNYKTNILEYDETIFDLKLAPYCFKLMNKNDSEKYFAFEPGIGYLFESATSNLDLWYTRDKNYYEARIDRNSYKANEIRPYLEVLGRFPVANFMTLNFDVFVSPVYFVFYNTKLDCFVSYPTLTPGQYNLSGSTNLLLVSAPSVETTFDITLFKLVAVSARFKFEHLNAQIPQFVNLNSVVPVDQKIDTFVLRVGVSLVNVGKANVRFKTGIFYEWNWEKNSIQNDFTKTGKWIFGVGTYNL